MLYNTNLYAENARLRRELNIPDGDFCHFDTPCTVDNQIAMLQQAGFSSADVLYRIEDSTIIVAKKQAWRRCGLSQNQPFCDGSHKTTDLRLLVWQAADAKEAWLCLCKHTKNPPYCSGIHKTL